MNVLRVMNGFGHTIDEWNFGALFFDSVKLIEKIT